MITNVLLVRYRGGFLEVEDTASVATYGRREGFLSLGDVEDEVHAESIAYMQLLTYSSPQESIDLELEPRTILTGPNAVYSGWRVGDYVTAPQRNGGSDGYRVRDLTVSEDEDGQIFLDVGLNSRIDERTVRIQRWLKRYANGSLGGRSDIASLAPPVESVQFRNPEVEYGIFSFAGLLVEDEESPPWSPARDGRLASMTIRLGTVDPDEAVVFLVKKNGTTVATGYVFAGDTEGYGIINEPCTARDQITVTIDYPTSDAESLTVKLMHMAY